GWYSDRPFLPKRHRAGRLRQHTSPHVARRSARERLRAAPFLLIDPQFLRALQSEADHLRAKSRQPNGEPHANENRFSPYPDARSRIVGDKRRLPTEPL